MTSIATDLQNAIDQYLFALQAIPEEVMSAKPNPAKWSKKEIVGHLVDSAQTNIRRFVIAQYENNPKFGYDQDKWVMISGYQQYDTKELINLWYLLNRHFSIIIRNTDPVLADRISTTDEEHTIEWLAMDYIKHLRHHIHQVLELEPVAYP